VEVTDYFAWRGIEVSKDTRRIVHKIIEFSAELRSVSAVSRGLYISRRALGRRFMSQGLPVPSHWLHFARLLRVTIRLQNTEESVLSLGYDLGYPDGFFLGMGVAARSVAPA
jgi:AraC-like DNA-binding protein